DDSSDLVSFSTKFLIPNVEVSVSDIGNEPATDNNGNDMCTGEIGTDITASALREPATENDGEIGVDITASALRPDSISGCNDVNSEHAGFGTFRPDFIAGFDNGVAEHVDFGAVGTGTSSDFVHSDDTTQNAGIGTLIFGNSTSVHDVITTETECPTSGYDVAEPTLHSNSVHPMITRSKRGIFKPKILLSLVASVSKSDLVEPKSFSEATKSPNWQQAMAAEYEALLQQQT
ncbi:hypothetical protein U1Q18_033303, partial [Sarracenia purpurea var. burkii]